jgi:hypothetical protein
MTSVFARAFAESLAEGENPGLFSNTIAYEATKKVTTHVLAMGVAVFIGAACGLAASMFTRTNLKVSQWRARYVGTNKWKRFAEPMIYMFVFSTIAMTLPFAFTCRESGCFTTAEGTIECSTPGGYALQTVVESTTETFICRSDIQDAFKGRPHFQETGFEPSVQRYNELVAVATVPLPPGRLAGRGDAVRLVHALEPTDHFAQLTKRAAHKAHRVSASGASEADIPSVVLYACIVLKPAPEGTPSAAKGKQAVRAVPPGPAVALAPDVADVLEEDEPASPKLSVRELAARFESPSPGCERLSTVPEEGSPSGETSSPSPHSLAFIAAQELAAARREAAELKAAALAAEAEAAALEEALSVRDDEPSHA